MEPESHAQFSGPEEPHKVALVSIAISLKRIADALQQQPSTNRALRHYFDKDGKPCTEEI